jgi:hypothetical protein
MAADPMTAWLEEHQDDAVMVGLLDLMRLVGRLGQVAEHFGEAYDPERAQRQMIALKGLCDRELPALEAVLPHEALEIIAEEIR